PSTNSPRPTTAEPGRDPVPGSGAGRATARPLRVWLRSGAGRPDRARRAFGRAAMTIEAGPEELFTTLATERDVPGIVALVHSAYRGTAAKRGWTSEEHLIAGARTDAASIQALLREPGSVILLLRGQF